MTQRESVWSRSAMVPVLPALKEDAQADVCIIGAGISGLSVAYHLSKAGKSVIVIDDGLVGGGETGRTTAHLVTALDDRYFELESLHGEDGARLAAESHSAAIDTVEQICRDENIDCDFERVEGYLFLSPEHDQAYLEKEFDAAHRAGLSDLKIVDRAPLGFWDTGLCLRFPRQGQFHPLKYLNGLVEAIKSRGGRIYSGTHASGFHDEGIVETSGGAKIRAGSIVVATNSPVNDRVAIHVKQAAYRSYVIAGAIPTGVMPPMLLWDTNDPSEPYHYLRLDRQGGREILIVGGEDHKTGQEDETEKRFEKLERWTRERFPMLGPLEWRWSGQIMEPADSLAFIGMNPGDERTYIVTGDSGNGITHGTIAGLLISDLILGRKNEWAELYDPSRKRLKAARYYAAENLNTIAQYRDWVAPGEVKSVDEIQPGEGAVIRRGLHLVAAYRDESGELHERSAVCPHLFGILAWNPTEKTWDCPAHGSRFSPVGEVLNGPALGGLHKIEDEKWAGPDAESPGADLLVPAP